ncbi:hypothetical protein [Larkinella terrae]|uniref:Osmoprotectant transporter permease n=1 Tax=Larkinella terrae TaxID=2025311 RepID=A0A7K0ESC8_9BACT|nr:hypothetical protein [Larkinella terrae]MRS64338.1 hypothetical protein [Larkinella terrae]
MSPILKIVFAVPLVLNALITTFYFVLNFWGVLTGMGPSHSRINDWIVLTGLATILALLGWAYHLAIVQERSLAGFGVLGLSILAWPLIFLAMLLFGKVHWQ